MALYHRGMYTQSPPTLVAQLLLLLSLAYLLKCLLRVCSELDTLLFSPWRWEYSSEKIKKQQTKSLPSWCLYSPGERQTINKSNGDNCYGGISSREERRVEGCGSYNCKQGGSVDCQRRKDLKQVREEGMQISGGKSISQRRNSKWKGPDAGAHLACLRGRKTLWVGGIVI